MAPIPFEKTYALKIDYTGRENYASAILSYREGSKISLGFFGGWTVSDAILLYGEGVITQGTEALYPQQDSSPFGASMRELHHDDHAIKPVLLIGGSYTFETKWDLDHGIRLLWPRLQRFRGRYLLLLKTQGCKCYRPWRRDIGLGADDPRPNSQYWIKILAKELCTWSNILRQISKTKSILPYDGPRIWMMDLVNVQQL